MRYRVTHRTTYTTTEPVSVCHNLAHLMPRATAYQTPIDHDLQIDPRPSSIAEHLDTFGNPATAFSFSEGYGELRVEAVNEVEVRRPDDPLADDPLPWEKVRDGRWRSAVVGAGGMGDVRQFLFDSPRIHRDPAFAEYARVSFTKDRPLIEAAFDLTRRVHCEFEYSKTATSVTTPIARVFEQRAGVCQDFAQLQIAMLRSIGLPACYVSGYIRTYRSGDDRELIGAGGSHAWVSVYSGRPEVGDAGWIDLDPTNDKFLTDEFVTLARGRDYSDVAPIKGIFVGSGRHELNVAVRMQPVQPEESDGVLSDDGGAGTKPEAAATVSA